MAHSKSWAKRSGPEEHGLTLIELIVATTILLVLSGMAVPMARVTIKRQKEKELRCDLATARRHRPLQRRSRSRRFPD
jgi:prepilin-type N-terminal cleavage/methylation domain-containing protein